PSVYLVTLNGVSGSGTLGLKLIDNGSIQDLLGHHLVPGIAPLLFQNQATFATGKAPYSVTAADVSGDGLPDLVVANFSSNTIGVLLGNGNGTFQAQATFAS